LNQATLLPLRTFRSTCHCSLVIFYKNKKRWKKRWYWLITGSSTISGYWNDQNRRAM